jgi:hypothetical protein
VNLVGKARLGRWNDNTLKDLRGLKSSLNLDCASKESQKREHMQSWLRGVMPSIQQIVNSQPEERNWGSAPTGTDHRPRP